MPSFPSGWSPTTCDHTAPRSETLGSSAGVSAGDGVESTTGAVAVGPEEWLFAGSFRTLPVPQFEPWLRFQSPLVSRVGDWRAGLGRSLCSLLARSFVCECHTISAVPRFQPPPRRTQHADFSHCALLFASPQGLWDLSCRSGFRRWSNHSVAIEQLQSLIQPSPTPPRSAEALSVRARTWTYNPQSFQDVSAFALTYILRLRSCKSMDAFVISSLPSLWSETLQTAGLLRSTGVTPPHRYCEPIRHPLAFDRLPG